MRLVHGVLIVTFCLFGITMAGCDPGFNYNALDPSGKPVAQWSQTIEGVRLEGKGATVLIGSSGTSYGMEIANESNYVVVVLGGELITKGRTLKATLVNRDEDRTLTPGSYRRVTLSCDFESQGGYASDVLSNEITWVWRIRIGDKEHVVRVPMRHGR